MHELFAALGLNQPLDAIFFPLVGLLPLLLVLYYLSILLFVRILKSSGNDIYSQLSDFEESHSSRMKGPEGDKSDLTKFGKLLFSSKVKSLGRKDINFLAWTARISLIGFFCTFVTVVFLGIYWGRLGLISINHRSW